LAVVEIDHFRGPEKKGVKNKIYGLKPSTGIPVPTKQKHKAQRCCGYGTFWCESGSGNPF